MTPKLVVCTPLYGTPQTAKLSVAYHNASNALRKREGVDFLAGELFTNCDLVRARSRAVQIFVERSSASNLLFWDEDVIPRDLRCIDAMLASGKDVISLPYPRKRLNFPQLADAVRNEDEQGERGRQSADELEAAASEWPIQFDGHATIGTDALAEVTYAPAGFMMLSRVVCERLIEAHKDLVFRDTIDGVTSRAIAVFMLMIRNEILLSEDFSFCQRWRDMGEKCWILADPADHIGPHRYRGHWQGLVGGQV